MFGMRHRERECGPSEGGRRWRRHFGGGFGGRHGPGGSDTMRAGRMLAQGDIQLIALALIAEQPRHGYEIIKVLEEKTAGWYSPSPGIVYPTLTYLEEAGYVTAQAEGAKKLYSITEEGRAYLADNKEIVDAVMERFAAIRHKVERHRERERDDARDDDMPRSIRGAFLDLSEAVRDALRSDGEAKGRIIDIIERAAAELKAKKN